MKFTDAALTLFAYLIIIKDQELLTLMVTRRDDIQEEKDYIENIIAWLGQGLILSGKVDERQILGDMPAFRDTMERIPGETISQVTTAPLYYACVMKNKAEGRVFGEAAKYLDAVFNGVLRMYLKWDADDLYEQLNKTYPKAIKLMSKFSQQMGCD